MQKNNISNVCCLFTVDMQKPKELFKEIVITSGGGGGIGRSSSQSPAGTTEPQFAKKNSKIIHPPIESHWHSLPSLPKKDCKGSIESGNKFKKMLSYPIKFRDSFKPRRSQSSKDVLEEIRSDSKDQELVDSFREMLLNECQSQQGKKHYDYHTLLRSAAASLLH